MPNILAVETALPEHRHAREDVARAGSAWLADSPEAAALFHRFLGSSETGERFFVMPLDEVLKLHGMSERTALFERFGPPLGATALERALAHTGRPAADVTALVFTSCSVPVIPSIDALIIEQANLPRTVARIPLFQHGCAGGVIGLEVACDLTRTAGLSALISVELCSLVFQPGNHRAAQLVGAALFADGAGCALIGPGDDGLAIVGHESYLLPESRHLMGYDIFDDGFHLRLDRDLPHALALAAPARVAQFLHTHGLASRDVAHWLFHPGGVKILEFLEERLALAPEQSRWSRDVLGTVGNLSSATVLFVLKSFLDSAIASVGDYAVMMGIGPGLTLELILFRWQGRR